MSAGIRAEQIDALLPQTQCTQCGYAGCMPYARAIAAGAADINQCPPGGAAGIARLATVLGREAKPLNPVNGTEKPRAVALIDEARCIGCTLCIQACPVDAIVGAARLMHSVIAELCTGCELCLPPCPVDCINLLPLPPAQAAWTPSMADAARARHALRTLRLARELAERADRLARKAEEKPGQPLPDAKEAAIRAALQRARARKAATVPMAEDERPARRVAATGASDPRRGTAAKK